MLKIKGAKPTPVNEIELRMDGDGDVSVYINNMRVMFFL
jgi:hypothetical protein